MGKFALSEEILRRKGLMNYVVSIHPFLPSRKPNVAPPAQIVSWPLLRPGRPEKGGAIGGAGESGHIGKSGPAAVRHGKRGFLGRLEKISRSLVPRSRRHGSRPVFRLNQMSEQSPNPDSRIILSDERDSLGRKRVRLDWRLSEIDIDTIIRSQEILDMELRRAGLGHLEIQLRKGIFPANIEGGWHHMGTTRMQRDPQKGVVDENARVHSISNLYIAGPSVFPTGGYANPVLTSVALAIRLADHIKRSSS